MDNCILFIGPPGCGKTYAAKKRLIELFYDNDLVKFQSCLPGVNSIDDAISKWGINQVFNLIATHYPNNVKIVSFHPAYSYYEFVEGISTSTNNGKLVYTRKNGIFLQLLENMHASGDAGYIILDDIDRVDLGAVLGELLNGLDNRNQKITLMSGLTIAIPDNLFVIGTMRGSLTERKPDYGILRRFNITRLSSNRDILLSALNEFANRQTDKILNPKSIQKQIDILAGKDGLYEQYNQIVMDNLSYEFLSDKEDYNIGHAYFMPNDNVDINHLEVCCQHKIRHQVFPLLKQYESDGIIFPKALPTVAKTNTLYTRNRHSVGEPTITIWYDEETKDYSHHLFVLQDRTYSNRDRYIKDGSLPVNSNYLMVFAIVEDAIVHNLINDYMLMDILQNDKQIAFARGDLPFGGGGLVATNSRADRITQSNSGRNSAQSFYSNKFHLLSYYKNTYRVMTKINGYYGKPNILPYDINSCFATSQTQNCNPFKCLKVFVYKYLLKFHETLNRYIEETHGKEKTEAIAVLNQLEKDIDFVKQITTDRHYIGEKYYVDENNLYVELVNCIRNIETWKQMCNETLKGVYRKMDSNYKEVMALTDIHQMILQGPPGTSKTYGAKTFLAQQMGIISDDEQMSTDSFNRLDSHKLLFANEQYELPQIKSGEKNVFWELIQFHPSYCYEDFVRGIKVSTTGDEKVHGIIENSATSYNLTMDSISGITYKTVDKTFGLLCSFADSHPEYDFYLLIDEINRANLSTVFGELIYALEYRDTPITTPYSSDKSSDPSLKIPNNLFIIGTMNTADKSIGNIDYAIRRRFLFFPMLPDEKVVIQSVKSNGGNIANSDELKTFFAINSLFSKCVNNEDYETEDVQIGHTYFLRKSSDNIKAIEMMKSRFFYQILPILNEYVKDGVLSLSKMTEDINSYFSILSQMIKMSKIDELEQAYNKLLTTVEVDPEYTKHISELG